MNKFLSFSRATLIIVGLALIGIALGTWIGGRYFVAPGSGLAGPAIALGYGLIGAVIALAIGILLIRKLSPRAKTVIAIPVTIAGVAIAYAIAQGMAQSKAEQAQYMEEALNRLNPYQVTLTELATQQGSAFDIAELDWGTRRITLTRAGEPNCVAPFEAKQTIRLLGALRDAEVAINTSDVDPCAQFGGKALIKVQWKIHEVKPPDSAAEFIMTDACIEQQPALSTAVNRALKIAASARKQCR